MRRNLLMLAFEFPPQANIGIQRALKLAKYLPEHGVRPTIVTVDRASCEAWCGPSNEDELLAELSPDLVIHRVACPFPKPVRTHLVVGFLQHFLTLQDPVDAAWRSPLLEVWDSLVAEAKPSALYVGMPPSIGTLALELARRSRLPLILDFRDHWSHSGTAAKPTWVHYQVMLRRERKWLEGAAAITGVTGQLIQDLQLAHPRVPKHRFHVVPNGYDAELPSTIRTRQSAVPTDAFVIGYVGRFYYSPGANASVMSRWWMRPPHRWLHYTPRREDWLYRSPFFFFKALQALLADRPELRSRIKVRFIGDCPDWLHGQIDRFGLEDVVEHLGRVSHRASQEFQETCDALLMTSVKVIGGRDYCIAGKTFEYVTSGRPVVAFVAEGEQRDFLKASGIAQICDPDNPAESASTLASLINGEFRPVPRNDFLRQFHRRETARKMAEILSTV